MDLDVLTFDLSGYRYALAARTVREVVRAVSIRPLPKAPAVVEGVINVRGTIVPVLDIRSRFRLPQKPLQHTDHLIVAWAGARLVAIRADRVADLAHLDAEDVADLEVAGAQYVAGVAKLSDGLVLIHDLESFLTEAETYELDEAVLLPPDGHSDDRPR